MSQESEMGRVLLGLQEKLASVKQAVSSVQAPYLPQLAALNLHIDRIERSLASGAESCLNSIVTNEGKTAQDLPYIKSSGAKRRTPLSIAGEPKVRDIRSSYLKREVYAPKNTAGMQKRRVVPEVSEDELSGGLLSLINKGKIPKEVDLTPAFERGAAPLSLRPSQLYKSFQKNSRNFTLVGQPRAYQIRYDFAPPEPKKSTQISVTKQTKPAVLELNFKNISIQKTTSKSEHSASSESREDIEGRDYDQLLDEFSSHFFIIRKGKALVETPEFASFQRTFARKWASVSRLIRSLEFLMTREEIPLVTVDGKKLAGLDVTNYTDKHLVSCIVNYGAIQHYIRDPELRFLGETGRELAAVAIQAKWRMHKAHSAYIQLRQLIIKAKKIQRAFRRYNLVKQRRLRTASAFKDKLDTWKQIQAKFKADWPTLSKQKRVEVHLGSLSIAEARRLTMSKLSVRQNLELTRIFRVQDPNVKVIYISSLDLSTEILGYYYKVLEIGDIIEPSSRVTVITPELMKMSPRHLSTTRALLYCRASMKRLKELVSQTKAYIVPYIMSNDEIELSVYLGIPVLGGDPSQTLLSSTKSGNKRVFTEAEVPVPPAAIDIYDEHEFYTALTRLIAKNLHIETWLFKIDDEFAGRGTASLDLSTWKTYKNLKKSHKLSEAQQEALHRSLHSYVPAKVNILMPTLHPSWSSFLKELTRSGGVIEATPFCLPSKVQTTYVSMLMHPDSTVQVIGGFEKLTARNYQAVGYSFPQTALKNINLQFLCSAVAGVLYPRDIIGYVGIELVSFPDPSSENPLFWAIDLDCHLNEAACVYTFFDFFMEGSYDQITGQYYIDTTDSKKLQERSFLYLPFISHPGLSSIQYKSFFYLCRMLNIAFDLEEKVGSTFLLPDSMQCGVIGLMCMGKSALQAVELMSTAIDFVSEQAGPQGARVMQLEDARMDDLAFTELVSSVKLLLKRLLKTKKPREPVTLTV